MKFIHCADIHLDSPLRGLEQYEGVPVEKVRGATRQAFVNLIDRAISNKVDFVIIAGDLYDGDWKDFNTGLFFVKQMAILKEAGIKVFIVRGNHDAESRITKDLPLPSNVHVFRTNKPDTIIDENLGIAVHGQSFSQAAVTDDLASTYPKRKTGLLNIGVLHTSLGGYEGHANYAPCNLDTLISKGYHYWALGHVHKREILNKNPWIVFPGNTQGRHIKETGIKGCELITIEAGEITSLDQIPLDVLRWAHLEVDVSDVKTSDEVLNLVNASLRGIIKEAVGCLMAVRVEIFGNSSAHDSLVTRLEATKQQIRALALESGLGDVWIEKVKIKTSPEIDIGADASRNDPIGNLVQRIRKLQGHEEDLKGLPVLLQDLKRKLPPEITEGMDALLLDDPEYLRSVLMDVEKTLIPRLLENRDA